MDVLIAVLRELASRIPAVCMHVLEGLHGTHDLPQALTTAVHAPFWTPWNTNHTCLKSSRSSALSMEGSLAPMSSTLYFSRIPPYRADRTGQPTSDKVSEILRMITGSGWWTGT